MTAPPPTTSPSTLRIQAVHALGQVQAWLQTLGGQKNVSPADALALRLAVEEVLVNIYQHGYCGDAGPVTIRAQVQADRILIRIEDQAPHFDPRAVTAPELNRPWRERVPGGLGWHLVQQVMDVVEHEPVGAHGNILTLTKLRS